MKRKARRIMTSFKRRIEEDLKKKLDKEDSTRIRKRR